MDILVKDKLHKIVSVYEELHSVEFRAFQKQLKQKRANLLKETAALKGTHVTERHLLEIPESLMTLIEQMLTPEERALIWNTEDPTAKGALWFAKEFPQYSVPLKF